MIDPSAIRLIAIVGPTGAGKSDLAIYLAQTLLVRKLGGEIINCDSVQVYQGFEIGAAKIPVADRGGVRHHLMDVLSPGEELTAGGYARMTRPIIKDIAGRGQIPIVVGGTGFWLRALLDGLSPAPVRHPELRARLQTVAEKRPKALHRLLRRLDAEAAARIHTNDTPKLIRAIEISCLTGLRTTEAQSAPRDAFSGVQALKLCLDPDRKLLHERINQRTIHMFNEGLIEETQQLMETGYSPTSKPLQSVGYKQAVEVIDGRLSLAQAIAECQARTRQYAKRQLTWFRGESGVAWLHGFGSEQAIKEQATERSLQFLHGHYGHSVRE